MLASWELLPYKGPDITLTFLVVGEDDIWMTPHIRVGGK
jgi:hypothetical protein